MVQWLTLHATNAEGRGSISGEDTNIPYATWRGQGKKNQEEPWKILSCPHTLCMKKCDSEKDLPKISQLNYVSYHKLHILSDNNISVN